MRRELFQAERRPVLSETGGGRWGARRREHDIGPGRNDKGPKR